MVDGEEWAKEKAGEEGVMEEGEGVQKGDESG